MKRREIDLEGIAREIAGSVGERRPRTGPRSRLVDAIMVLLLSRPMRAAEIAGVFGLESRYVSSYLSYWRTRGYVDYDAGFWFLTPRGEEYAHTVLERARRAREGGELESLAREIASEPAEQVYPARNDWTAAPRKRGRGRSQPFIARGTGKSGKKRLNRVATVICALDRLRDEIEPDEFEVVNTLLSHYSRWGSTYLYADQLQERLNADYTWLMKTLRSLQSKNLVYLYTDPRLGLRVGISRRLKEILEECSTP